MSITIEASNGQLVRRHLDQIRKRKSTNSVDTPVGDHDIGFVLTSIPIPSSSIVDSSIINSPSEPSPPRRYPSHVCCAPDRFCLFAS